MIPVRFADYFSDYRSISLCKNTRLPTVLAAVSCAESPPRREATLSFLTTHVAERYEFHQTNVPS